MSGKSDSPDLVRAGGRLLGFGVSGTRLTDGERAALDAVAPAAIVLFARNVENAEQLRSLIAAIRQASDPSPVLMIDEEGGRVDRLRTIVPGIPAAADVADCDDADASARLGRAIGSLLAELDIEVNLAPVVDLWREGLSPSLLRRCFGADSEAVTARAAAFIKGMGEQGVLSCLKHFPGLGVASTDPHHTSSIVDLSMEELEASDLGPYHQLGPMAPAVMVGHGIYPKIDTSGLPGTLSSFISTDLLRNHVGFEGLAVTDDMEMHAVSDMASSEEIAERSVLAGNDVVLFCSRIDDATTIAHRLGSLAESVDHSARFFDATRRVERFVRQCMSLASTRDRNRAGLEAVKTQVSELRADLDLA